MISLLGDVNNCLFYFVNTLDSTCIIKLIKNTISKSRVLSLPYNVLRYMPCDIGIIISNKKSVFPLTLISASTISICLR